LGSVVPIRRAHRIAWSIAVPLAIAIALAGVQIAVLAESGPEPPFARSRAGGDASGEEARAALGPGLHVAGSGSGVVICRALARALRERDPSVQIVVHDSIGSTGGVRAVHDGAVDVGVITRPLHDHETALGLRIIPIARVPAVAIAHPEVRDEGLSSEDLLAIYRGERARWSDGTPLVALLRERGDSSHAAIGRVLPEFRAVNDDAIASRRFRILYHDEELVRAVLAIRGAFGISDTALVRSHATSPRILAIDGRMPDAGAVGEGGYPYIKPLSLVFRGALGPEARAFVDFARSEEGARVLASLGAAPVASDGP
jgi:phosphate transport system substrate-binding protein